MFLFNHRLWLRLEHDILLPHSWHCWRPTPNVTHVLTALSLFSRRTWSEDVGAGFYVIILWRRRPPHRNHIFYLYLIFFLSETLGIFWFVSEWATWSKGHQPFFFFFVKGPVGRSRSRLEGRGFGGQSTVGKALSACWGWCILCLEGSIFAPESAFLFICPKTQNSSTPLDLFVKYFE
jgi:hypothetical protein